MKLPITVIVPVYNEELNIRYCLDSISSYVERVVIIDSDSNDKTIEIASQYLNVVVYNHPFVNFSEKLNWAINNTEITSPWIFRLDADEMATPELIQELEKIFNSSLVDSSINGYHVQRHYYFLGRWIKHGSMHPVWALRIWRKGKALCEERLIDEYMILDGNAGYISAAVQDYNRKGVVDWSLKHVKYANREKMTYEIIRSQESQIDSGASFHQSKRRRWAKESIYYSLPLFLRPILYFIYRYFFRLGFLDGIEGLVYHFLHSFWYRFLVDTLLFESKKKNLS